MSDDPPTPTSLAARATATVSAIRGRLGRLSRAGRILLATTIVAAIAIASYVTWRSSNVNYAVLYAQLDREDAAAIVARLRELHVAYRLAEAGTAIEVPAERVHEVRLELATAGLPRGGGVGFESFDRTRLGATEFDQRVLYRRALEGELSRSISTLRAVAATRVHLVMSERSVFVSRSEPASASIVVRLRPGSRLDRAQVSGIVHLVVTSVPSLAPSHVTLVTTEGAMLHRPSANGEAGDLAMDEERGAQVRALESGLEERARGLLERLVGPGHVDVRASVELDISRTERVEDHYDPARSAVRSDEHTVERTTASTAANTMAGVPGAESNLPTGAAPGAQGATGQRSDNVLRESTRRNFEVDHVNERRVTSAGNVRRVTLAVVVDGVHRTDNGRPTVVARPREEMDRLAALVRGAVGADDRRGDVVTVECAPFQHETSLPADAPTTRTDPRAQPPVFARMRPTRRQLVIAAAAAAVLLLAFVATRVRSRRREAATAHATLEAGATTRVLDPGPSTPVTLDPVDRVADLRGQVHARAASDPASAALVIKHWLGLDDSRGHSPSA